MTFDQAFEHVIGHEGGYVNHPDDPGGETKFGISKRSYPDEDIAGMTLDRAKEIYKRDYWDKAKCGQLPHPLDFQVFDAAVNSGAAKAVRWLQQALPDVRIDGVIGPQTITAARAYNAYRTSSALLGLRLEFMTKLGTWPSFGRGWARRIAGNLRV